MEAVGVVVISHRHCIRISNRTCSRYIRVLHPSRYLFISPYLYLYLQHGYTLSIYLWIIFALAIVRVSGTFVFVFVFPHVLGTRRFCNSIWYIRCFVTVFGILSIYWITFAFVIVLVSGISLSTFVFVFVFPYVRCERCFATV